ncbi:hypothetical protein CAUPRSCDRAFT_12638 [Caulochytrium protostelioides]|uniref:Uncharacterized protein n=1 Tax=Caulochytrium protostelioides TaxID=1555241 RepID=A0A4P9WW97_9FUNG|nr:hypothetical protein CAUPRSCDRAFT_12638 [Caulochytrium protostelioides]
MVYGYKGTGLSMGTMIMGWDAGKGPALFYVDSDGQRVAHELFSVGSGSTWRRCESGDARGRRSAAASRAARRRSTLAPRAARPAWSERGLPPSPAAGPGTTKQRRRIPWGHP